jgi:hypothetical protein
MTFHKGYTPWNKSKHLSKETRKRISESKKLWYKTHKHPLLGTKTDRDTVEKQRQGRLVYCQTHSAPNKGKKHTEKTRKKIAESCRRSKAKETLITSLGSQRHCIINLRFLWPYQS